MTEHPGRSVTDKSLHRTHRQNGWLRTSLTATDTRNSIEVTMRRLVRDQFCEARWVPGSQERTSIVYVEKK